MFIQLNVKEAQNIKIYRTTNHSYNTSSSTSSSSSSSSSSFGTITLLFAFLAKSLAVRLYLAVSFQFINSSYFRSNKTSSCHRCPVLPTALIPISSQNNCFLVGLPWSILSTCPSSLILYALMNLTIFAPSLTFQSLYICTLYSFINLSISETFINLTVFLYLQFY